MHQKILGLLNTAFQHFQKGELEIAKLLFDDILKIQPKNFDALHILGIIYGIQKEHKKALELFRKAVKVNPANNFAQFNLAKALSELNKDSEALIHIDKATKLAPKHPEAWLNFGIILSKLNRSTDAITCYDKAINLKEAYLDAFFNKGVALQNLEQFQEANLIYEKVLELQPNHLDALLNKALVLQKLNQPQEAKKFFEKLTELNPDDSTTWFNQGVLEESQKNWQVAIDYYNKAIALNKDYQEALCNKGICLNTIGKYQDAIETFDRALSINPNYSKALSNKGVALKNTQEFDLALNCYNKAVNLDPAFLEAKNNRALLNLTLKNFSEAWEDYSARPTSTITDLTPYTRWDGTSECNHLLLINEQGIGDEIFYISLISLIKGRAQKISLMTDKRLIPIINRTHPEIGLFDKKTPIKDIGFDQFALTGDIPKILGLDIELIQKRKVPFLKPNEHLNQQLRKRKSTNNNFLCGISWKSANEKIGENKSLPLLKLEKVLSNQGCSFVNLQYGEVSKEITEVKSQLGVEINQVDGVDLFEDIDGLLSIINACDIVVTTSNVTAHLAGAIGKKTLLLVPYTQGRIWYWHDDEVSIWYPSIKQYFQDVDLSWDNAINKIAAELEQEIARKN